MLSPDYQIRRATVEDIDILVSHRRQMFAEIRNSEAARLDALDIAYRRWLARKIPDGEYLSWVALDEHGLVVAGAGLLIRERLPSPSSLEEREGYVANVYTNPECRGHGLAHRLMETMMDWCREHDIRTVTLFTAPKAEPIYRSLGFKIHASPAMDISLEHD
ncbi:MAG TPA: GNAT family N-acetyltransferase [Aggregatilineales bacterium]|nr:GNAT family N-acetyltransferase [Aggregatilineales bacterium]